MKSMNTQRLLQYVIHMMQLHLIGYISLNLLLFFAAEILEEKKVLLFGA